MQEALNPPVSLRKKDIVARYIRLLDQHISELKAGTTDHVMEIRDFAALLHVHPGHLSNTIKEITGQSTCDLFEERLVKVAKELLLDPSRTISQVAQQLTYDPSNFTKFFKHFTGQTPKAWRNTYSG